MIDAYSQLRMEIPVINQLINDFDSGGIICQYSTCLKEAVEGRNKDAILYYLKIIIAWFEESVNLLKDADSVYEYRDYKKMYDMLIRIYKELNKEGVNLSMARMEVETEKITKIFLSHKSTDKEYADILRDFIIGLGIKEDQLIYTSHPLHKIPLNTKIYDYLRKNINNQVFMIILWSNDYLESPACLCEMGAAWVSQTDYVGIYTPGFIFGNPKYNEVPIDTSKMGIVLNKDAKCKTSMIEFKNKIQSFFKLENDEKKTSILLDDFMDRLSQIMDKQEKA